jgi:hypothetical protein
MAALGGTHTEAGQEQCYDNVRVSKNAWDTNLVKVRKVRTIEGHIAESGTGKSGIHRSKLGQQRWWRICRYPDHRKRTYAGTDTTLPRSHRGCTRYRLVGQAQKWLNGAHGMQEPVQRLSNRLRLRRWEGVGTDTYVRGQTANTSRSSYGECRMISLCTSTFRRTRSKILHPWASSVAIRSMQLNQRSNWCAD